MIKCAILMYQSYQSLILQLKFQLIFLGHIFEQSLTDLEELQANIDNINFDKTKTKRKKMGVFYTREYITHYIVYNTLGKLCNEKKRIKPFRCFKSNKPQN